MTTESSPITGLDGPYFMEKLTTVDWPFAYWTIAFKGWPLAKVERT